MTTEEAKDYVMTHLPCTMKGIVTLFDTYFHGAVRLEKLVGLAPKFLGYNKLVFYLRFDYLHFDSDTTAERHPMPRFRELMRCFRAWAAFHSFVIVREDFMIVGAGGGSKSYGHYVVWIKPPIEIKEDR